MCLSKKSLIIIFIVFILCYSVMSFCNKECFNANDISDPDMLLKGKSLCMLSNEDDLILKRKTMTNDNFIILVNSIKKIVIDTITEYAKKCNDINGNEKLGADDYTLTLACNIDPFYMEQNIVNKITDYIIDETLLRYNVKINRLITIHHLMKHLELIDTVIYPLQNSNLYTVHGIQYITVNYIKNAVENNLEIHDVLYTILSRANIVIADTE